MTGVAIGQTTHRIDEETEKKEINHSEYGEEYVTSMFR